MEESSWGAEVKKFDFGRVKFEILVRHPSGNVEWDIEYTCLNFRREIWARYLYVGVIVICV